MQGVLLDTNVLSELMRPQPSSMVLGWFILSARYSVCGGASIVLCATGVAGSMIIRCKSVVACAGF